MNSVARLDIRRTQSPAQVFRNCAATTGTFVTCVTLRDESAEVTLLKLLIPRPEPDRTAPRPGGFRPALGASRQAPASLTRNGSAVRGGYLLTEVTVGHDHSGEPQYK